MAWNLIHLPPEVAFPAALAPELPTIGTSFWRCVTGAARAGGGPEGCGYLSGELHGQPQKPGEFFLKVTVSPEARGQGLGELLYRRLLDFAAEAGASRLHTSVAGDDSRSRAFAGQRGFVFDYEMLEAELDLSGPAETLPGPAAPLSITSLAEEPAPTAALRELYILDRSLSADIPQWAGHMPPFEQYAEHILSCDPEAVLIARDGALPVAMAMSSIEEDGLTGYTDMLGVMPSHRRLGLARGLKLRTIAWARRRGLTRLRTHNNAASTAICTLNASLGYRTTGSTIYLTKSLAASPQGNRQP